MGTQRKKQAIKLNNDESLQGLLQETYNDACLQIIDTQKNINEITTSATPIPENIDDLVKLSKAKSDLLKNKDSAIKIKLEIAKLQIDVIKYRGDADPSANNQNTGPISLTDFKQIREILKPKIEKSEDE